MAARRKKTGLMFILGGVLILYLSSISPVAKWLMFQLERDYAPVTVAEMPQADVIVLLGGGIINPTPPRIEVEFDDAGDRLAYAARLFKAGKAPRIVVSGGNVFNEPGMQSNAEYSAELLQLLGVPTAAIVLERTSRNTYENARNTALVVPAESTTILLVTSAFHMRRSVPLFKAQGFNVIPAPTDIQFNHYRQPGIIDWLPDERILFQSSRAIKEFIGYEVYRWKGWL